MQGIPCDYTMSANDKTAALIDVLQTLEVACKIAGRAKDPVRRLAAAEMEVEFVSRRQRLEREMAQPDLPLTGTDGP
jgi:hypothetical protein